MKPIRIFYFLLFLALCSLGLLSWWAFSSTSQTSDSNTTVQQTETVQVFSGTPTPTIIPGL